MPQAVIAVAAAVAIEAGVNAIVVAIVSAIASAAAAAAEAKRAKGQAKRRARSYPRDATIRSAVVPHQIVYGRARVGGPLVYIRTEHAAGSTNNTDLWWVQPLAAHRCADVEDIWLDDKRTTLAQITSGGGPVLAGSPFYNGGALAAFYKHLGSTTQTVNTALKAANSDDITDDFRGRGYTYLVGQFTLANNSRHMYTGVPQVLRGLVKGSFVYDPRRDPSSAYYGGSGSQDIDDETTWEWSESPPLCTADFLRNVDFGFGVSSSRIEWGEVAEAADFCATTVSVPGGTEARFTCNGVLSEADTLRNNLDALRSSFAADVSPVGGKWRFRVPKWRAPGASDILTSDHIGPDVVFRPSLPVTDTYNTVRSTIFDASRDYVEVDAGEVSLVLAA